MTTDTLATASETSALDTNGAAEAFSKLFATPQETPQEAEPEREEPTTEEPEADPVEDASAEEDDSPVTIEVDGKKVELSKAELADYYKNGLRQADYTRKTMEVSEQRKAAEAETQRAMQERTAYAQNLQKMAAQLEGALEEQAKLDWDSLLQNDPVEYLKQRSIAEKRQAALQENFHQQAKVQEQFQAEQQKALAQHIADQQGLLLAKIPEWKDKAKAKTETAAIRDYLLEQGYDQKAVETVADAKAVILARKAMLYDQMIAKASAAAKKVSTLPTKVERPGTGKSVDQRSSAYQKLTKSGSIDDAAAVFRGMFS